MRISMFLCDTCRTELSDGRSWQLLVDRELSPTDEVFRADYCSRGCLVEAMSALAV